MRVLLLTRYGPMGASSRMRSLQFLPLMEAAGWDLETAPFFTDNQLSAKYRSGRYGLGTVMKAYAHRIGRMLRRNRFDLVWIEKEALPWLPASLERWLLRGVPYVLDFDDAVFHNYDRHRLPLVRRFFGQRLDRLMAGSRLVIAGNHYLAQRAANAGAPQVEIVPTVVDLTRYSAVGSKVSAKPQIVWIGSPSTVRYLITLAAPLALLASRVPFTLRVIGGGTFEMPGVNLEIIQWSAETEAAAIAECDIGLMPLEDSPWEKGKCAYKLIQYMACGLPTVASPVGANLDVVIEGETGYFAETGEDWVQRLEFLLRDSELRHRLGSHGRERVKLHYSLQQVAPKLLNLLSKVRRREGSDLDK